MQSREWISTGQSSGQESMVPRCRRRRFCGGTYGALIERLPSCDDLNCCDGLRNVGVDRQDALNTPTRRRISLKEIFRERQQMAIFQ